MNDNIEEIEDDEYESIVEEKRHNELVKSLEAIKEALSKDNDKELINAIKANNKSIVDAISKIEIKEPKEKEENLQPILNEIKKGQEKILSLLTQKPTALEIERGTAGLIQTINIKYGNV